MYSRCPTYAKFIKGIDFISKMTREWNKNDNSAMLLVNIPTYFSDTRG